MNKLNEKIRKMEYIAVIEQQFCSHNANTVMNKTIPCIQKNISWTVVMSSNFEIVKDFLKQSSTYVC